MVEGRFCFEGGSRCGKGEGLHVLVTDQGEEITDALKLASQGLLAARRRPASRKSSSLKPLSSLHRSITNDLLVSDMDSPRRIPTRPETRISDLSCTDAFMNASQTTEMSRSIYGEDSCCNHASDATPCTCRTNSPFWSTESAMGHNHGDLDSNYGCGDTASVSEMLDIVHNETWTAEMGYGGRGGMPTSLERYVPIVKKLSILTVFGIFRCMSCISKLGAPSMSRSSTATVSGTPGAAPLFSPAWTMENASCTLHVQPNSTSVRSTGGSSSDRTSLCSHSSSGNSEYSVPRNPNATQESWYERTTPPPQPLPIPPKSPKIAQNLTGKTSHPAQCQCCVPARPPKPHQLSHSANSSPSKKPAKKPPMPLPIPAPLNPPCTCQENSMVGPYENYDVPKMPFLVVSCREKFGISLISSIYSGAQNRGIETSKRQPGALRHSQEDKGMPGRGNYRPAWELRLPDHGEHSEALRVHFQVQQARFRRAENRGQPRRYPSSRLSLSANHVLAR